MKLSQQNNDTFWQHPYLLPTMALILLIGGGLGYWLSTLQIPSENSADVGFARDMSDHHIQAVQMATLLYDRTEDEEMRILAYDNLTTQQGQIGIMGGWLDAWGHSLNGSSPRMEWMGMSVTGLMPGMATQEEINELRAAQSEEADVLFIRLMIPHHRSGVEMAEFAASEAKTAIVRNLAQGMADVQQFEIEYMQELIQAKGHEPVPDEPMMNMEDS